MKKILFTFIFSVISFISYAQDKKIDLTLNNQTITDALIEIEKISGTKIYFQKEWFDNQSYTRQFDQTSTIDIIKELLSNTSVNVLFFDNKIILTKNSYVYQSLPSDYFDEENLNYTTQNAVFFSDYNKELNTITIGKQDNNIKQDSYTIKGKVIQANNNQPIGNVAISIGTKNLLTNQNGIFEVELPSGTYNLKTNLYGFEELEQQIIVYGDGNLNLQLEEGANLLDEVIIDAEKATNVKETKIGVTKIDIKAMKTIPVVLGERDVLKVATIMPGVKTTGEGAAGFNVRGGRADQNLVLLDDGVIYSPTHFLGFFSAINPFTTESAEIYKASIPSKFGGRLSSVFDIKTKKPNYSKFTGEGSIGPITANLSLQTPIVKDKIAITTAVRATYSDWILRSLDEESLKNSEASFYDVLFKYNHKINDKNELQATGYYSKDKFSITSDSLFGYDNALASIKWHHKFNNKHNIEITALGSKYDYDIDYESDSNNNFLFKYSIKETELKVDLNYDYNKNHNFNYGINSKLYNVSPGDIRPQGENSIITSKNINEEKGLESALYVSDIYKINKNLTLDLGLRYSLYKSLGPAIQNIYETNSPKTENTITETLEFNNNETITNYSGPEFRLSARYLLSPTLSLKASYNKTIQYIHLLSNNTTISPTDTWKLSDLNTKPQKANQFSLGLFKNIDSKDLELSIEGYYKTMTNMLDYKVGAELILNDAIEQELLQGEGRAYGVEFLLKKKSGNLNGWIGYTYSRTELKLNSEIPEERVNNGNYFPTNYDKPHDLSIVANYKLTKRYSLSANFIYQTGRPITYPIGKYNFGGSEQVVYSDRNQIRIPDYYRLDLGVNIEGNHKLKKLAHSFWNISVYNVLGRNNPYSVFFENDNGKIKAYQASIFSIPVPTITYNFKF